jgi:hypothetical protein
LTDFSHERSINFTLKKPDYEEKKSVLLLEERGSHMDDLTPPDLMGPSAAKPASAS